MTNAETFDALGCPFPLFKAATSEASDYAGIGTCDLCRSRDTHIFELGIGSDVIVGCPLCSTPNALAGDKEEDGRCTRCGATVPFPKTDPEGNTAFPCACYACLRQGRAAFTHDTVFGMVRWQDAQRGETHGLPGAEPGKAQFQGLDVSHPDSEGWRSVRIPSQTLLELVRTPRYVTWQGERWPLHCGRVMAYLGPWRQDDFEREAKGAGQDLFRRVMSDGNDQAWELLLGGAGCYIHQCTECGGLCGYWDMD